MVAHVWPSLRQSERISTYLSESVCPVSGFPNCKTLQRKGRDVEPETAQHTPCFPPQSQCGLLLSPSVIFPSSTKKLLPNQPAQATGLYWSVLNIWLLSMSMKFNNRCIALPLTNFYWSEVSLGYSFIYIFWLSETGFLNVALAVQELTLLSRLALNSEIRLPLLPECRD